MRIALVTFIDSKDARSSAIISRLASVSSAKGNTVERLDGTSDSALSRLSMFDYIAIVYRPLHVFSSALPPIVTAYLAKSGPVSGKKGCAIVVKSGLSSARSCRALMHVMEAEGICVDYFEIVRDVAHADSVGGMIG